MAINGSHGGRRRGAGRPRSHDEGLTVACGAAIPKSIVKRLDRMAKRKGVTRSTAICEAVRQMVGQAKP